MAGGLSLAPAPAGQRYNWQGKLENIPIGPTGRDPAIFGDPNAYVGAAAKSNSDYDAIMANYKRLFDTGPIAPISYTSNPDVTSALSNLKDLSSTGGYSDQAISDLRARGISPIRSIYAEAQQKLERQRALSGGYSPNMAAATAKMAREQSDLISGRVSDVNAGIAENVARNRLSAASPYASLASSEAGRGLDVSRFNTGLQEEDLARKMQSVEGMRGLYGTNPALTSTFGNQVATAAQLGQNQQDINNRRQQSLISSPLLRG